MRASLLGCFDPKGGRNAGRDFYGAVGSRSTACGRSPAVEHVPLDTVQREWPIAFKQPDLKGDEAPSEERPVRVVR